MATVLTLLAAVFTIAQQDALPVAYGVSAVVAAGYTLEGVTVAVFSSLLLVPSSCWSWAVSPARVLALPLSLTSALSGLVSSGGATPSAVLLYRGGTIDETTAMVAILLATAAGIGVKAAMTVPGPDRRFAGRVAVWGSVVLGAASLLAVGLVV